MHLPYARLVQLTRVVGEANREERRWDAFLSYRENPPREGNQLVPFDRWLAALGLAEKPRIVRPNMDKIDRLLDKAKRGEMRRVN